MKDVVEHLQRVTQLLSSPEILEQICTIESFLSDFSDTGKLTSLLKSLFKDKDIAKEQRDSLTKAVVTNVSQYLDSLRSGGLIQELNLSLTPDMDEEALQTSTAAFLQDWMDNHKDKITRIMENVLLSLVGTIKEAEERIKKIRETEESLERHKGLVRQYADSLQRLKSDFDNYKQRVKTEKERAGEAAVEELLKLILPVLDSFDSALGHAPPESEQDEAWQGLRMIRQLMDKALRDTGLEPIDTDGAEFNPEIHEAMFTEQVKGIESETVLEEMRSGYRYRGRVIRPSQVKVGIPD